MNLAGCVCPHPPLLVPEIGRENLADVTPTAEAMQRLGRELGECDLVVIVSPHTQGLSDAFTVKTPDLLWGDFSAFGCPEVGLRVENDIAFVDHLLERAAGEAHVVLEPVDDDLLDHGILVPMHFIGARRLVSLSIVLDYAAHVALGRLVRVCAQELGRQVLFVASGDLSHRLIPGAPAGYDERGTVFDDQVVDLLRRGDFGGLAGIPGEIVQGAGECGLRSLMALGGFLGEQAAIDPRLLSYEGPFGVGYAVAAFNVPLP